MQINNEVDVKSSISTAQHATIKACPTAFKILSSQIYTDKESAFIREVSCNASDSHTEAGKPDLPITVTLPTRFTPDFIVEDFGTGIPHDKVMEILMTYFGSSRQGDNTRNGGFGLGSKSPLAYTDQFSFENTYDNLAVNYLVYIEASGALAVSKIGESTSEKKSGVKVVIPVRAQDVDSIVSKAAYIYSNFRVKPIVNNAPPFVKELLEKTQHNRSAPYIITNAGKFVALMGDVAYSIDKSQVDVPDVISKNAGLILNFNIGDLEVHVSREMLSYNPQTIKAINDRLIEVEKVFIRDIQKKVDTFDHIYNLMNNDKYTFSSEEYNIFLSNTEKFTFKGNPVIDSCTKVSMSKGLGTQFENFGVNILKRKGWSSTYTEIGVDEYSFRRLNSSKEKISILHIDYDKYIRMNVNLFADKHMRRNTCFTARSQEAVDFLKDTFKDFIVEVVKMSDQVAAGCRPEKKQNSGGTKYTVSVTTKSVPYVTRKLSHKEIVELVNEPNTYVTSENFRSPRKENDLSNFSVLLSDDETIITLSAGMFGKFVEKGVKSISEFKLKSEHQKKITASLSKDFIKNTLYGMNNEFNVDRIMTDICTEKVLLEVVENSNIDQLKNFVGKYKGYLSAANSDLIITAAHSLGVKYDKENGISHDELMADLHDALSFFKSAFCSVFNGSALDAMFRSMYNRNSLSYNKKMAEDFFAFFSKLGNENKKGK